jgi:hypothetical protein
MNGVHFVAFRDTLAHKVVVQLSSYSTHIIDNKISSIENFVEDMCCKKASYIVSLGEYSGVDRDKLRYETECNKKFRNSNLAGFNILKNDNFLKTGKLSRYTSGMGNSWCNLLSIKMLNAPKKNYRYAFIHIPKSFDVQKAVNEILTSLPSTEQ